MKKKITALALVVVIVLSLAACNKGSSDASVSKMMDDIKEVIKTDMIENGAKEDQFKDGKLPEHSLEDVKTSEMFKDLGIKEEWLEEGSALVSTKSLKSDKIIILKAKDEKYVAELGKVLNKVLKEQKDQWSTKLPDQYKKVKGNIMSMHDKYLIYITYDNPEKIEKVFNETLNIKEEE